MEGNDTWLKEHCEQEGLDVFGVGKMAEYDKELVGIDSSVKERFPFAISFGLVLSKGVIGTVEDGPNAPCPFLPLSLSTGGTGRGMWACLPQEGGRDIGPWPDRTKQLLVHPL